MTDVDTPGPPRHGRTRRALAALGHAARPSVWRAALTLDTGRIGYAVPLRVGLAAGLVLIVGGLTGQTELAGFAALGALISAFGRPDPYRARWGKLIALGVGMTASTAIGGLIGLTDSSMAVEIIVISVLAGVAALFVDALRVAGPGAVVFVFSAAAAAGYVHDAHALGAATVATALGAACGAIASLLPWLRALWTADTAPQVRHEGTLRSLRRCGDPDLLRSASRITAAAAIAAVVAASAGLSHPMWAAMGATAALQGVSYHHAVTRGVARLVGNITGGLLAAVLLAVPLGYWGIVVAVVIFQTLAEITATINYALCSTWVTPMALLLTAMSAGLTPAAAIDRVLDTLIGVAVGIVVGALTIAADDPLPSLTRRHRHH
ncbi:FUSC family protein [Gordonia sp. ABSL1-1]|uniref:FUSC family protein n=1 Tax=Gordonia sp. ABSL1-1 TaxID=3053923 RepID=UPI002573AC98|nr:FUSC family protein [Gordonia sp. ABSL1-1]MDL9937999.1 FUSC family protein [Gordonia sp. ABSL1-1]